jgi:hypothetical protein
MVESLPVPQQARISFGPTFTVLGILMGGVSLISLIQRWTGIEIVVEVAADAISLYRQMIESIHWALFAWWTPMELPWGWTFEMPTWGMDALAVWVIISGATYRGVLNEKLQLRAGAKENPAEYQRAALVFTIAWLPLAPLGFVRFVWHQFARVRGWAVDRSMWICVGNGITIKR